MKKTTIDELESAHGEVERLNAELRPAEKRLETVREKMWRMLGSPTFGSVRIGPLVFSKTILAVTGVFGGLMIGTMLAAPGPIIVLGAAAVCAVFWFKNAR